jgi:hypothetical protein
MPPCSIKPIDKKKQITTVGNDLVSHYGKKKFYSIEEVKDANKRQGVIPDFACLPHAFFNSHQDFDQYHSSIGEDCDYATMKADVIQSISKSTSDISLFNFNFDMSWLEFPDIDLSLFDVF